MSWKTIIVERKPDGVAWITLNRPDAHNAMDGTLLAEVPAAVAELEADRSVRAVVLTGAGESFCAGGDLRWMQSMLELTIEERLEGSRRIASILGALGDLSKPLIGRINGSAFGGGVGLMAVCDIVIAASGARFGLTEVKLGLIPANIGPYVVRRMGEARAREVFLNARIFEAEEAVRLGLVSRVVAPEDLDAAVARETALVLKCGPDAVAACKRLIGHIGQHGAAESLEYAMMALAEVWKGEESVEGIAAFFEKRPAAWIRGHN